MFDKETIEAMPEDYKWHYTYKDGEKEVSGTIMSEPNNRQRAIARTKRAMKLRGENIKKENVTFERD